MPPGVNRIPCALSQSTAAGRSSIHSPMWFSVGTWTFGRALGIERLHEVDLDGMRPGAEAQDVLVDVLRFSLT